MDEAEVHEKKKQNVNLNEKKFNAFIKDSLSKKAIMQYLMLTKNKRLILNSSIELQNCNYYPQISFIWYFEY